MPTETEKGSIIELATFIYDMMPIGTSPVKFDRVMELATLTRDMCTVGAAGTVFAIAENLLKSPDYYLNLMMKVVQLRARLDSEEQEAEPSAAPAYPPHPRTD